MDTDFTENNAKSAESNEKAENPGFKPDLEGLNKPADELVKDLVKSVGLIPEFVIEPLKDYIKKEVTYRMAQEFDHLIEKKLEPSFKRELIHHIILMVLLLLLIVTILFIKIK